MLKVFVDTEFTDFHNCDLISIGLVTEQGQEFYMEVSDYNKNWASDFVITDVLTKCIGGDTCQLYDTVKERLQIWLSDILSDNPLAQDGILFLYDYYGDGDLLKNLLSDHPKKQLFIYDDVHDGFANTFYASYDSDLVDYASVAIKDGYEIYFMSDEFNKNRHNALVDARALHHGWRLSCAMLDRLKDGNMLDKILLKIAKI